MNDVVSVISSLGFPIVACIGLAWFCRYMIDTNNKNIEKMFALYEKSNEENREAIKALTNVVEKLNDNLEKYILQFDFYNLKFFRAKKFNLSS